MPHSVVTQLESEIRQHYELENAQACAKWKQLHLQRTEAYSELAKRIESEYKQLCKHIGAASDQLPRLTVETSRSDLADELHQVSSSLHLNQSESELRLQLASDWVQQERFNLQEAFTAQTKKIQADFLSFMEQLDREYELEREQILHSGSEAEEDGSQVVRRLRLPMTGGDNRQLDKQFKSSAKRHMLVHTAPVVDLRGDLHALHPRQRKNFSSSSNKLHKTDVSSEMQQRLDTLQEQLRATKDVRDIMQQRNCVQEPQL